MGKKKKSASGVAPAADAAAPAASAPASSSSGTPAVAPVSQPWASNYEALKIVPITPDPTLFLSTDSLALKVNNRREGAEATPAPAPAGSSAASASAASSPRLFQFGIYDSKADTVGRRAIALRPIPAGTLLLSECGQPWITHAEHADKVCHQCAACIYDPKVVEVKKLPDGSVAPSRHLHCSECDAAFYCSPACQAKHRAVHELECPALQQFEEISDLAKCNADLVRAAIKYAVGKGLEARQQKASAVDDPTAAVASLSLDAPPAASVSDSYDPYHFQSTPSDRELLMDHLSANNPVDLRNMKDAAALVLKALAPEFAQATTTDRIVSFMCRLNSNCHALNLEEHATIQFGFGLYPLCAIFNHSCYPNCIFINEGANLTFRVIRSVEAHEELTVNYVSLYAPRTVRRKELWLSKKFFCQCRRCNLKPKNQEEKDKFALDAALGGVACQAHLATPSGGPAASASSSSSSGASKAKCPGYYRINYQMRDAKVEAERRRKRREEKAKKKAEADAATAATAATSGEGSVAAGAEEAKSTSGGEVVEVDTSKPNTSTVVPTAAAASEPAPPALLDGEVDSDPDDDGEEDDSDYPLSLRPKVTSAKCTVCGHSGKLDALTAIQAHALDKSEHLLAVYAMGRKTPQMIKDEFEAFLLTQQPVLAPQHSVLFNLLLPLVNVTSALGDHKAKLDYCRRVVDMAEACYPAHFLPTCNYYQAMANTYRALLTKGIQEKVPKKMLQRYKDEQVAVLEKLAASMRVCRGEHHLLTQAAVLDVAKAKKFSLTT